ncbi:MAG: hypothetical protein ACJA0V_002842 [Planctomycetota bacterium]|jgi:hypothetical protein
MVAWPRARQPVGSQNARRYLVVMGVLNSRSDQGVAR